MNEIRNMVKTQDKLYLFNKSEIRRAEKMLKESETLIYAICCNYVNRNEMRQKGVFVLTNKRIFFVSVMSTIELGIDKITSHEEKRPIFDPVQTVYRRIIINGPNEQIVIETLFDTPFENMAEKLSSALLNRISE